MHSDYSQVTYNVAYCNIMCFNRQIFQMHRESIVLKWALSCVCFKVYFSSGNGAIWYNTKEWSNKEYGKHTNANSLLKMYKSPGSGVNIWT